MTQQQRPCAHCGKPTANKLYCGVVCMNVHRLGPSRHCANCGAVLTPKQKSTCSHHCYRAAVGGRPRASAATDARVRELWRVEPPIRQADIGAMMEPPVSKAVVARIARRLKLPHRDVPRVWRAKPPKPAAAPRAQRPPMGPSGARNPPLLVEGHPWRASGKGTRKPQQAARAREVAVTTYVRPPLGEWLILAHPTWCEECREARARRWVAA